MTRAQYILMPRDGFFCKDGRGWQSSSVGRTSIYDWPQPHTILGGLRTAWGHMREEQAGAQWTAGQWPTATQALSLRRTVALCRSGMNQPWSTAGRLWPRPADAVLLSEMNAVFSVTLQPADKPVLGIDDDPAMAGRWRPGPLPDRGKPLESVRWWPEKLFIAWLLGQAVNRKLVSTEEREAARFVPAQRMDTRLKIAADTQTAAEGMLFSPKMVETLGPAGRQWAIGVDIELSTGQLHLPPWVMLGGARRPAEVDSAPVDLFAIPDAFKPREEMRGLRLITVTPALFGQGWLPDGFNSVAQQWRGKLPGINDELILRGALVDRPLDISGWDMARREPKAGQRFVQPGSVYFFTKASNAAFTDAEFKSLWLAAWGQRNEDGFGLVVPGRWQVQD